MSKNAGLSIVEMFGIVGALASLAAVGIWVFEHGDATESRSLRQAEIMEIANNIIRDEASDGHFKNSPDVAWAFHVFAKYGVTAEIEAQEIDLLFADLRCVSISAKSNSFSIASSMMQDTIILYESQSPLNIESSLVSGGHLVHHYDSDDYELILKDNFISYFGYINWAPTGEIPRVSLENTIAIELNVSSAAQSLKLEAYKANELTEVSNDLCNAVSAQTDADGFMYTKCQTENSAQDLMGREFGTWLDAWGLSNLFGAFDSSLCKNRQKIKLSRTPFQGAVN